MRYVIDGRLGAGGMAEVFRARLVGAEGFARPVALKRITAAMSQDERFAAMFIAEARIAALLSHPNVVSVLDFDRDPEGQLFLAMELVDGADLRTLGHAMAPHGLRFTPSLAAFVVAEVLRGLAYAHELAKDGRPLGIVHRDVSPHNVLVSRSGVVKLADFGIAKATASATASVSTEGKGKIAYMAPEQARALPLDGRCDVYAAGVMLYELLAGERPYGGVTEAEILASALRAQPVPVRTRAPDVPEDLAAVTMRMFAADRDVRYASASEAAQALRRCACFSANGEVDLAQLVRTVLPEVPPVAHGTPMTQDAVGAAPAASTSTPLGPSRRALVGLGVAAAISVAAAAVLWWPRAPMTRSAPPALEATTAPPPTRAASSPDAASMVAQPSTPRSTPANVPVHRPAPTPPPAAAPTEAPSAATAVAEGWLSVRVSPWANVTVDGDDWGSTPLRRAIPAGSHRVVLQNEDLGRKEQVGVEVVSGREQKIDKDWR